MSNNHSAVCVGCDSTQFTVHFEQDSKESEYANGWQIRCEGCGQVFHLQRDGSLAILLTAKKEVMQ